MIMWLDVRNVDVLAMSISQHDNGHERTRDLVPYDELA